MLLMMAGWTSSKRLRLNGNRCRTASIHSGSATLLLAGAGPDTCRRAFKQAAVCACCCVRLLRPSWPKC